MSSKEDSKYTPQSAEAVLKGQVKIEGKVITVPAKGLGLKALGALDYLEQHCGATVRYEHVGLTTTIHPDLRGKILVAGK